MKAKVRYIGNSLGILIPKKILDDIGIKAGDELSFRIEGVEEPEDIQQTLAGSSNGRKGGSEPSNVGPIPAPAAKKDI